MPLSSVLKLGCIVASLGLVCQMAMAVPSDLIVPVKRPIQNDLTDLSNEQLFNCLAQQKSTKAAIKCYEHANQQLDHQLNLAYKQAQKACKATVDEFNGDPKACLSKLKVMQRNWISYRDTAMALPSALYGVKGEQAILVQRKILNKVLREQVEFLSAGLEYLGEGEE